MADKEEERKYVRDSTPSVKPEKCPKCGSTKITSCPGGNKITAVPGIWWICDDCKHEW